MDLHFRYPLCIAVPMPRDAYVSTVCRNEERKGSSEALAAPRDVSLRLHLMTIVALSARQSL